VVDHYLGLHYYLRAGTLLLPLVILRGKSVDCNIVKMFDDDVGCVTATENG